MTSKSQEQSKGGKFRRFCVRSPLAPTPRSVSVRSPEKQNLQKDVRIGVLGASGYTGSEVILVYPYTLIHLIEQFGTRHLFFMVLSENVCYNFRKLYLGYALSTLPRKLS